MSRALAMAKVGINGFHIAIFEVRLREAIALSNHYLLTSFGAR